MRKKIRHKTPNTYQMATSAPSINSVLGYLRDKFDINDINGNDDIDFYLDVDLDLSDNNDNIEPPAKRPRGPRKKVLTEHIPTHPDAQPQVLSPLVRVVQTGLRARIGKHAGFRKDKRDLASTCKKLRPFYCPVSP